MYLKFKTLFDLLIILIFLPLIIFIFFLLTILVFLFEGFPIFIIQKRIGKHNKTFNLIKFRTLKKTAPNYLPTNQLDIEKHSNLFGKYLRKTGLDELPQIFNIISGNMSIIGPRPLLLNQDELIRYRRSYKITTLKPGITGLAQINPLADNNDLLKITLDKKYLDEFSFKQDLIIFIFTIKRIIYKLFEKQNIIR